MVINKTAVLPRINVKLLSVMLNLKKTQTKSLITFVEGLGTAFQIQDDIIALTSDEYAIERGYGEDIREGKRSLMVIKTLKRNTKNA